MLLTAEQRDEFSATGRLRLRVAFPVADAESMCDQLWEFLAEQHALDRDDRPTWTLDNPSGFQSVTHSGAFRVIGGDPLYAALDALFGSNRWARPRWWGRPLLTIPGGGSWELPARGWHFDLMPASAGQRPVRPRMMLAGMIEPRRSEE